MSLLDRSTLASLSNRTDILNTTTFPDAYLNGVLSAVGAEIERYLQYRPWLSVWTNEEGPVVFLESGAYAGRYLLTLRHRPLVPGGASAIFSSLTLTYALALTLPSSVDLTNTVVEHSTARVYTLAPGFVDALSGAGFAYGGSQKGIWAVGYVATYVAGWSTGLSDPTPAGGGSYGADPIPKDIQYAAALLAQEALAVQAAQNANTQQPYAGILAGVRVGEREERYAVSGRTTTGSLGYGGPLAAQAEQILARYKKTPIAALV